jgi:hypothetical protein
MDFNGRPIGKESDFPFKEKLNAIQTSPFAATPMPIRPDQFDRGASWRPSPREAYSQHGQIRRWYQI